MAQFTCSLMVAMLMVVVVVGQVNCELPAGFERCDDTGAVVKSFFVSACPQGIEGSACKLTMGRRVGFALDFASAKDFGKVKVNFGVANDHYARDACSRRFKCPGKAGHSQMMADSIYLEESLPKALDSDTMEFYATDAETNERLVCIRFPIEIEGRFREATEKPLGQQSDIWL